jgi:hypothetical protein
VMIRITGIMWITFTTTLSSRGMLRGWWTVHFRRFTALSGDIVKILRSPLPAWRKTRAVVGVGLRHSRFSLRPIAIL